MELLFFFGTKQFFAHRYILWFIYSTCLHNQSVSEEKYSHKLEIIESFFPILSPFMFLTCRHLLSPCLYYCPLPCSQVTATVQLTVDMFLALSWWFFQKNDLTCLVGTPFLFFHHTARRPSSPFFLYFRKFDLMPSIIMMPYSVFCHFPGKCLELS